MKFRRQELRRNATEAEKNLWDRLKQNQIGAKFIRQYSIGNWVVDFYCPEKKLAIEVDGEVHKKQKIADGFRDKYLNGMGISVLRFRNEEVMKNIAKVLTVIEEKISPSSVPPLNLRGGK